MTTISVCAQCGRPQWHFIHSPEHPSTKNIVGKHNYVIPEVTALAVPTTGIQSYTYGQAIGEFLFAAVLLVVGFWVHYMWGR